MADVERGNRPLSPHLQIYRPQLTAFTSIMTRITGNGLIVTAVLIVWWFVALASGPEAYDRANGFLTSWFGDLIMTLSVAAMWYHLLAGLRHVWWDNTTRGMDIPTAYKIGYAMLAGTVVLTLLTLIIV
ncbi:succinate dehydrogenase [Haematobacter missouriensis]|mgnify:FL=1|uniref:Succinate dehydrogenase cytochrome b556 subunit n=2 Tax=Haematobacter TaxID=366614 RepID=A0A212ASN6_9RHOB|nr:MULTISPECIES: succinate dehydrogenase, cytochrome b556 subunit [Haematobacter]KFI32256.1 succinate dehydrogenase [Haematobacter missouriensis]OWJ75302.1 succinate dehydrogenase, cytochrome b556 subunit [Haematobacter missouriensis]OWJ79881.1 succinate dehydrogenase, cytochrome b556 subunit [Haematobacter genomosp. 1]OWJ84464.1 succinate dehydrogenase, cytochrome b556 subunit [Haematobacter missouriensis]